jgi:hypothetical protein
MEVTMPTFIEALYPAIAGIIIGWLPIMLGLWKLKAADSIVRFAEAGDFHALESGINNLRLYYMTTGIMFLITIGLMVLGILAYILMFVVFGIAMFGAAASGAGG